MRVVPILVLAVLTGAAPLAAQDSASGAPRAELRDRIEQAFMDRAREEMSLTDDQAARLEGTARRMFDRRLALDQENRRLTEALAAQLRPGVAGDPRVIRSTLDSIVTIRVAAAQLYRDEQREMAGYLTDVQRGQYHLLRDRILARIEDVRMRRNAPLARPMAPGRRRP